MPEFTRINEKNKLLKPVSLTRYPKCQPQPHTVISQYHLRVPDQPAGAVQTAAVLGFA